MTTVSNHSSVKMPSLNFQTYSKLHTLWKTWIQWITKWLINYLFVSSETWASTTTVNKSVLKTLLLEAPASSLIQTIQIKLMMHSMLLLSLWVALFILMVKNKLSMNLITKMVQESSSLWSTDLWISMSIQIWERILRLHLSMLQSFQMVSSQFAVNFQTKLKFLMKSSDQDVSKHFTNYFQKLINTLTHQRSEDQRSKWTLRTIEST